MGECGRTSGSPPRGAVLATLVALAALVIVASPVPAGGTGGPKLATSGPVGEGPYPWRYPGSGTIQVGSGTTVGGSRCTPGTPQFNSPYADPCVARFTGDNGGATYNGVTGSTITLAMRTFPMTANSEEAAAVAKQEGIAVAAVSDQVAQVFVKYFNKVYDLYGRHVRLVEEHAVGNVTAELLNGGQAQACADADTIAHTLHAFGEVDFTLDPNGTGGGGTGPFSACAAQDGLVEFDGGAYFDEAWYQQYNPYVWGIPQECERIGVMTAQVYGKYLANKPAIYAGDPALRTKTRVFGVYLPNLPTYAKCLAINEHDLTTKYHVPASDIHTFTYGLDISTFQQSAQQAIVAFKSEGVTTIVTACDSFSLGLLTRAAAAQDYHPEWLLNGVAGDDTDSVAQTYDQSEVTGSLFGLSEAAPQNTFFGPTSLAGKLYKKLTGHTIPPGTDGDYAALVWIFDALQAAGPDLTPQNMARGVHALPTLGAPTYVYGAWSWNAGPSGVPGSGDHTAVTDDRWVYWDANATSPINGKKGTYIAVFGGKRYSLNNWPATLPPLFTAPGSKGAT
jgi:hypothetical protein